MATSQTPTNISHRPDVMANNNNNDKPNNPPIIKFAQFLTDLTASQQISRTAAYAQDPQTYLQKTLGPSTVSKNKNLLCIPPQVDKDVYGNGEHQTSFQNHIAKLLGKEHGLFFVTGVMAQLVALRIHCDRAANNRVAWHASSHLEWAEEKAYQALYGLERIFLGDNPNELPTVEEIRTLLSLSPAQRPAVIVLELPNRVLGCQTHTYQDLAAIATACASAGVKLHCDGARLWEIEPYYRATTDGKTFADLGQLFDTIYVSFYKGLRGATGAMLCHSEDELFVSEAKMWRRRAGGNAFTLGYELLDCERGYNENIGTFADKWEKMVDIVSAVSSATERFKTAGGKRVVKFTPEKPTCCQIRTAFEGFTVEELLAARDRVQDRLDVRVFEKVSGKKTLDEMGRAEREKAASSSISSSSVSSKEGGEKANGAASTTLAMEHVNGGEEDEKEEDRNHVIEWMVVSQLLEVETQGFVDGYVALCEELMATQKGG